MKTCSVALLVSLTGVPLPPNQSTATTPCKPLFEPAAYSRGVPWVFVDQGLASIPQLHPRYVLLAQRRADQLGAVTFSLLVYKEEADQPGVTIEGMAYAGPADDLKAWRYSAHCSAENYTDGLVTTLEAIGKLSR